MKCFLLKYALSLLGQNPILGCFLLSTATLFSQISFFGDINIGCDTEVHIGFPTTYFKGGMIRTNRECQRSAISFRTGQQFIGAHNTSHVDGSVKVYQNGTFTFPLGASGIYSPLEVYVLHNPKALQIQYHYLHPIFYPVSGLSDFIPRLHYWSWIKTEASAKIGLPWRSEHHLESLISTVDANQNGFSKLRPGGLYQGQWVAIPGAVQLYKDLFGSDDTTAGSVISHERISFSHFTALTFIFSTPIKEENTIISQVITPNGDGVNDVWKIKGITFHAQSEIKIYNQHAVLIFFHKGYYANDWEGIHYISGQGVPEGAYYYTIDIHGIGKAEKTGWIYIKYE